MKYYIKRYTELSSKEINQIKNLIIEGDEVDVETLAERLSNVERISFFIENEEVISTASIKIPTNNYKKNTFINSKSNMNNEDFEYELGYTPLCEVPRLAQYLASRNTLYIFSI
jgi:hypothetical protein